MANPISSFDTAHLSLAECLRLTAEKLISENLVTPTEVSPLSSEVLALLYQIANTQEGSSDALKLLHEFQVHQVEIDLQFKQLEENQQDLTKAIGYYQALFQTAPVGYLITSLKGKIKDGNETAAELLGIQVEEMCNLSIAQFIDTKELGVLQQQLLMLEKNQTKIQFRTILNCNQRGRRQFFITARRSINNTSVQMVLMDDVVATE